MSATLASPVNIKAEPRDNSVFMSWDPVEGADGYTVYFYKADAPDKCVKKRITHGTSRTFHGFNNGTEYLAIVRAFHTYDGTECEGQVPQAVSFVTISELLKAQDIICIRVGETAQIYWECKNKIPMAFFASDNDEVATVSKSGTVRAVASGTANITVIAENQKFVTRVIVDRKRDSSDVKAVLMFAGDLMCTASQQRAAQKRRFDFGGCFTDMRATLKSADMTVGVLDTCCCDSAPYEYEQCCLNDGSMNSNSPSSYVVAAAQAGFGALVTSTNHSCNAGFAGLNETANHIRLQGMANIGTLGNGLIMRIIRGIRVAFIACTMVSNGQHKYDKELTDKQVWGSYSRKYYLSLVEKARKSGAEYIVAFAHWGTPHSLIVSDEQSTEAQFMADNGADLIIGSHPHVIQPVHYLVSSDGRVVPCAFSLGSFLSSQAELEENRDSIVIRAELLRSSNSVTADISYIPCHCFDSSAGVSVRPVYPSFSEESREAVQRIEKCVGNNIHPYTRKAKALLSGSVILERIFDKESGFEVDRTPLLLSQLTACGGTPLQCSEKGTVKLDVEKSFGEYIKTCGADFVAVDFYAAAAISCYQLGDTMYTGSKRFVNSEFYKSSQDSFKRIKPPFSARLWKPCIKRYADALLAAFPADKIILYRQRFSERSVTGGELRLIESRDSLNKRIAEMEDYFIRLVDPAVVDLSRCYFNTGSSPSNIEHEYFVDAANAAERILTQGRGYIDHGNIDLWYERVLRYYNSMTARGFQRWLLNMRCAADMIIAYTNEVFAARHRERLIKLKRLGKSELTEVADFYAHDPGAKEIVDAAEIIYAVLSGNVSKEYDFYAPAFRDKYNILKIMAKLLSVELQAPITSESAELAFLLRGKPQQLRHYLANLKEITVDVWGSALSKSVLDKCKNARVGRYIFGQCPLLANEALVPVTVPDDDVKFNGNTWRRRMTAEAFGRMGMFTLTNSGSKWLVIDFYDAVGSMCELNGGLFVADEFLKSTDFYKEIKPQLSECYLFEKRSMQQCQNSLKRFTEDLSYRYGKNIILVKADIKDSYITLDDRLSSLPEDKYLDLKRRFLSVCERFFIDYTGCCVLDVAKFYHASDRHPDGAGDVNYESEFYRRAAEYVSYVVNGGTTRLFNKADESYLKLRDLRLERK